MNKLKLTAVLPLFILLLSSCEKDSNNYSNQRLLTNYDNTLSGTQQVPANASAASGTITGTYDRRTKTYSYRLTWQGLTGNVTAIHIHGVADRGYVAIPVAPLAAYPSGIVQTAFGLPTAPNVSGAYTGSLYVDGTVVREQDLLAGKFYVDIHTSAFTGGEIRGQILLR